MSLIKANSTDEWETHTCAPSSAPFSDCTFMFELLVLNNNKRLGSLVDFRLLSWSIDAGRFVVVANELVVGNFREWQTSKKSDFQWDPWTCLKTRALFNVGQVLAEAFHLKSDKGLNFVYDKNGDAVGVCLANGYTSNLILTFPCIGNRHLGEFLFCALSLISIAAIGSRYKGTSYALEHKYEDEIIFDTWERRKEQTNITFIFYCCIITLRGVCGYACRLC